VISRKQNNDRAAKALPSGVSSRDRIDAAIEGHLVGLLQHGDFTSANIRTYGQVSAAPKKRNRAIRAVYASYWDKLLEEGRKKGEIRSDINLSVFALVRHRRAELDRGVDRPATRLYGEAHSPYFVHCVRRHHAAAACRRRRGKGATKRRERPAARMSGQIDLRTSS